MGQEADTRALELATQALARIDAHEKTCTERWREASEASRQNAAALARLQETTNTAIGRLHETTMAAISSLESELSGKFREFYNFMWRIAGFVIVCFGAAAVGLAVFIYLHGIR